MGAGWGLWIHTQCLYASACAYVYVNTQSKNEAYVSIHYSFHNLKWDSKFKMCFRKFRLFTIFKISGISLKGVYDFILILHILDNSSHLLSTGFHSCYMRSHILVLNTYMYSYVKDFGRIPSLHNYHHQSPLSTHICVICSY